MTTEPKIHTDSVGYDGRNDTINTTITIRPYADYFARKEEKNGFFRMIRKNWNQMSILWPGKYSCYEQRANQII